MEMRAVVRLTQRQRRQWAREQSERESLSAAKRPSLCHQNNTCSSTGSP